MKRTLAIAGAALREAARGKALWGMGVAAVLIAPVITVVFGADDATRAWTSRLVSVEFFRLAMPLGAIFGGAFVLRPSMRSGWPVLPARRAEWFAGTCIAAAVLLVAATGAFYVGALSANLAFGQPLSETTVPSSLYAERSTNGNKEVRSSATGWAWASGEEDAYLVAELPQGLGGTISGTLQYTLALNQLQPPGERTPVTLWLAKDELRKELAAVVESRRRIRFSGQLDGATMLIVEPSHAAFLVGATHQDVRFETGTKNAASSLIALLVLSLGAALLCMFAVVAVRGVASAPTAALAGILVFASLTLLPELQPADGMARDLRRDMGGMQEDRGLIASLEDELALLPQLMPSRYFDEFLSGQVVPQGAYADGFVRLGVGMLLLIPGALLFSRRQIR